MLLAMKEVSRELASKAELFTCHSPFLNHVRQYMRERLFESHNGSGVCLPDGTEVPAGAHRGRFGRTLPNVLEGERGCLVLRRIWPRSRQRADANGEVRNIAQRLAPREGFNAHKDVA